MNRNVVTDAIGLLSDRHILCVTENKKKRGRKRLYTFAAAAALVCLAVVIVPFAVAYSMRAGGDEHELFGISFLTVEAAREAIGDDVIFDRLMSRADEVIRTDLQLRSDPTKDTIDCYEDHRDILIKLETLVKVNDDSIVLVIAYNGVTKPYFLGDHIPAIKKTAMIGLTPVEYVYDKGLDQLDARFKYNGLDYCLQVTSAEQSEEKILSYLSFLLEGEKE